MDRTDRLMVTFWLGLMITLLVGACALLALSFTMVREAFSQPRAGTFAWNYRNVPVVAPFDGCERVVLSPRGVLAPGRADSVNAWGGRVFVLFQPIVAVNNGSPVYGADYPWDTQVWDLASALDAVLKTKDGQPADLFYNDARYDGWVLDYRDTLFVDRLAILLVQRMRRCDGVVWDYGCGDLAWAAIPGVDPAVWPAWREGFSRLMRRVRYWRPTWTQVCQCNNPSVAECDAALFERVGWTLNPAQSVWGALAANPGRRAMLRQEDADPKRRRLFACMALVTGSLFNQCNLQGDFGGGTMQTYRDPEHWEFDLGEGQPGWTEGEPGLVMRSFKRGIVALNLTGGTRQFAIGRQTYFVGSMDGLLVQTRGADGRWLSTWRTNEGR